MEYIRRALAARRVATGHGADSARAESLWMVAHVMRRSFDDILADPAQPVSAAAGSRLEHLLSRRLGERRPLAYLLREAWLGPHRFYVDERAIVPRSFIAGWLLEQGRPWVASPQRVGRVLDLCTGSGCLAILAALAFPRAEVDAVDISRGALAVARRNVRDYKLEARVRLVAGDLFEPLARRRYDLVLANPPYVTRRAMHGLPPEYRAEPALALEGGVDGLDVVRRILEGSAAHLRKGGMLILEVGRGRRRVERRYPQLALTWIEDSAARGMVLAAHASDLAACFSAARAAVPGAAVPRRHGTGR